MEATFFLTYLSMVIALNHLLCKLKLECNQIKSIYNGTGLFPFVSMILPATTEGVIPMIIYKLMQKE